MHSRKLNLQKPSRVLTVTQKQLQPEAPTLSLHFSEKQNLKITTTLVFLQLNNIEISQPFQIFDGNKSNGGLQ